MANTLQKVMHIGNGHIYWFNISSSAGPDLLQMPPGTKVLGATQGVFTSATPRAATIGYVQSTGVVTVGGVTAADVYDIGIFTN